MTEKQEIERKMRSAKASAEALTVKNALFLQGYVYQISLYMAIYDSTSQTYGYRRIEVLTDARWTQETWLTVRYFFDYFTPTKTYSIWTITSKDLKITFIQEWD